MKSRLVTVVVLVVSLATITACNRGPARSSVYGNITFNGKAIDGGEIFFIPMYSGGVPAHAVIDSGKYAIPAASGPSVGKCRVEIQWQRKTGRKLKVPPDREVEETEEVIPQVYNKSSQLECDIKSVPNEFSMDIRH